MPSICLSTSLKTNHALIKLLFFERFPGASAGYSLRQLHPDAIFAIRVRRSSDNQEMDIGFTSTGELDKSALLLFVGSGDGFVVIWYDQSGNNNHASQSVALQQPKVVNAGTVIKENGKPAILPLYDIYTTASDEPYLIVNGLSSSSYLAGSLFVVGRDTQPVNSKNGAILYGFGTSSLNNHWNWLDNMIYTLFGMSFRISYPTQNPTENHYLFTQIASNGTYTSWMNNVEEHTTSATVSFRDGNVVIGSGGSTLNGEFSYKGTMQEIIFYPSDQSTNRSNMNTEIVNHYAIP